MAFGDRGAWILGGPDVLARDPDADPVVRDATLAAADAGNRVVLLARAAALSAEELPVDLVPAALVIMSERLRPSAADTLRYFAAQDVSVKVISGDNPRTVGAIAGRLGLTYADQPVDARHLPSEPLSLAAAMEGHSVFGRVSPQQKRAMVKALQAAGHTVAMTGDGVNDALALKDADIGVAMGSGSEASRGVAQLVLLDSDFSALPSVVAEGRRVLGNIERTSSLYLTKTSYALVLALATGMASLVFPFLPRHLTLVALLTIGVPSFFLALAPNAERFRRGFIPRVLRFSVPAGLLAGVSTLLAYQLARHEQGLSLSQERTTAVMTLIWVGLGVLTVVAAPLTPRRLTLVWSMAGAFPLVLLIPWAREFFELEAPPLLVWLAAIGIAALVWSLARLFVPGPGSPTETG